MDTLLVNGQHYKDSRGLPVALMGKPELVQRMLIRLQIRKGTFLLDKNLGSELYKLNRSESEINNRIAMAYVQEALADMPEITIKSVKCAYKGIDELEISIFVNCNEEALALSVYI